jgi:hypothetical protein
MANIIFERNASCRYRKPSQQRLTRYKAIASLVLIVIPRTMGAIFQSQGIG